LSQPFSFFLTETSAENYNLSEMSQVARGQPSSSSLDNGNTSARKRARRMFHRVMSGLEKPGRVRLLTLTSSPRAPADFQKSFRKLRMRLLRRGLLVEYIRCPELTKKGARHEHILFRGSFLEQAEISRLWNDIHLSPIVDVRAVAKGKRQMAHYMASYMGKSPSGRYAYSWGWVWKGFAKSWTFLKRLGYDYGLSMDAVLHLWKIAVKMGQKPESHWHIWAELRGFT